MQGLAKTNSRQGFNQELDISRSEEVLDACKVVVPAMNGVKTKKLIGALKVIS